jgi:hypothetical protein
MQISTFNGGGGFVIHRITGNFKGRASAWFSPDGSILDAEQFVRDGCNSTRPVKQDGPMWQFLARIGKRYARLASGTPDERNLQGPAR